MPDLFDAEATTIEPERATDLETLRTRARGCTACDLYRNATQTVFGEGPDTARIMLIGEQPGDQEDRRGRPFVGPAGEVLNNALGEAGIVRDGIYVTNAVKHFKWEPRGKIRLHKQPAAGEIAACRPWFKAEIAALRPRAVVCLGVTAARAVFGRVVRLGDLRGGPWNDVAGEAAVFVTIHPSAILRFPDALQREAEYRRLVEDLRLVSRFVEGAASDAPSAARGTAGEPAIQTDQA